MGVNRKQTLEVIQQLLKGGTPKWYSHPEDYKAMVDEWHKAAHENLIADAYAYRNSHQEILTNPAGRRVNMMPAAVFMRKLRVEGKLTCFSADSQLKNGTASLVVFLPDFQGGHWEPICSIQVPLMWEWTTLRVDPKTGIADTVRDVGWRSSVEWLIRKGALTEERAHEIFGAPRMWRGSTIYREKLHLHRNGKIVHTIRNAPRRRMLHG